MGCDHWVCRTCYNHFCAVCLHGYENNAHQHDAVDEPCDQLYKFMTRRYRNVDDIPGMSLCEMTGINQYKVKSQCSGMD